MGLNELVVIGVCVFLGGLIVWGIFKVQRHRNPEPPVMKLELRAAVLHSSVVGESSKKNTAVEVGEALFGPSKADGG